jgi:hypothetical protein
LHLSYEQLEQIESHAPHNQAAKAKVHKPPSHKAWVLYAWQQARLSGKKLGNSEWWVKVYEHFDVSRGELAKMDFVESGCLYGLWGDQPLNVLLKERDHAHDTIWLWYLEQMHR